MELIHCKNGSSFYIDKGTAPVLRGKSTKLYYDGGIMTKHTAGPWELTKTGRIISGNMAKSPRLICDMPFGSFSEADEMPEAMANARLIAAAPELLGALKSLYAAHKFALENGAKYEVDQYAIDVLKEIITRAEGAL